MFGYVRPFKPQMKFCEYDIYRAVYCGLCKELGRSYGFVWRLVLSYDFAFLGLLQLSLQDTTEQPLKIENQRCIAHPLKKSPCLLCGGELSYTAASAVILIYHKLRDDLSDGGLLRRIISRFLLLFAGRGYKRAAGEYPWLASEISHQMAEQAALESRREESIDRAAEPTALMTAAIAEGISTEESARRVLRHFGYLLGRYIYIIDAADDAERDSRGGYNPFLTGVVSERDRIFSLAEDSIGFTLGELANAYILLDVKRFKPILDNIIYMGLKNSFITVKVGKDKK